MSDRIPSGSGVSRRTFLASVGAASVLPAAPAFARGRQDHRIPADKMLSRQWLRTLYERGEPTVYRGADLDLIGMPVGGIGTGQVYLGGDGKLWLWDIFNRPPPPGAADGEGRHYAQPPRPSAPIAQGFAIRVTTEDATEIRPLDRTGFDDVSFRGQYPMARVEYRDPEVPVSVDLEAFSPFTPLAPDESGLPVTFMRFTISNTGAGRAEIDIAGWLENAACIDMGRVGAADRARANMVKRDANATMLVCTADDSFAARPDFGSLALVLMVGEGRDRATAGLDPGPAGAVSAESVFAGLADDGGRRDEASGPFELPPVGAVGRTLRLSAGASVNVEFAVAWHFPGFWREPLADVTGIARKRRAYAARFESVTAVADHVIAEHHRLMALTRMWTRTFYDGSTLPHWFLERTHASAATLATATCAHFDDGRFYGWESTYCGPGTCTSVWHYAQAVAWLFPSLERSAREIDLGLALDDDTGVIAHRAEADRSASVEGQAGVILRLYREHRMSADDAFLRRHWPAARRAIAFLDGQPPTSMSLAAISAGEAMARALGDDAFAERCAARFEHGRGTLRFNGEYFIETLTGDGCRVDQLAGQAWAHELDLGRIVPAERARSALRAIWKYNFAPDVGPYHAGLEADERGRQLAMPGEGGLVNCTRPRGGGDATGESSECWTGHEHRVAAHMIREGLVDEGLAVARTVHDRYHASKRNPYNEVESGDHAARAMAAWGVYLAVCGFEHHGPRGFLGFAPKITPRRFRAAFTAATAWGMLLQDRDDGGQSDTIEVRRGRLKLRSLAFEIADDHDVADVRVMFAGRPVPARHQVTGRRVTIELEQEAELRRGMLLEVVFGFRTP